MTAARVVAAIVGSLVLGGFVWLLLMTLAHDFGWRDALLGLIFAVAGAALIGLAACLLVYGFTGSIQ